MPKITHVLHVEMDLNKPVEELTQVISSVLSAHPDNQKEILAALDLEIGNARAAIEVQEQKDKSAQVE
ncbi:hypothetical protein Q9R46_14465 [Paenibacillus sp. RRE4]|uniref:hypothetical protein n=1 Tax=Paenibacillus sp. RRE4 TaxID=2962587 RepID=UPI002880E3EC|nr:hypothetical protein [Paenibacillus sp. RRE4]MDT0123861.1 hypothetical protein [Paenibacillus sp. RRE4]